MDSINANQPEHNHEDLVAQDAIKKIRDLVDSTFAPAWAMRVLKRCVTICSGVVLQRLLAYERACSGSE